MTPKPSPSSNLFLFYGEDDFSIRRKIEIWKAEFAKKYSAQAVIFFDAAELTETELVKKIQEQLSPSLFSSKKLLIIKDGLPKKSDQEKLSAFLLSLPGSIPQDYFVVFWQTSKPDGRLKFTKEFKAKVAVTEFELPHGKGLDSWLVAMAKNLNVQISEPAANLLAQYLGRDMFEEKKAGGRVIERKEAFDLWQAYSELNKLAATAEKIEPEHVMALVRPKVPDSVFSLSDNLASGHRQAAFQALENYLETATGDEKSAFIKVIGLLAEQFRSLYLVGLLVSQGRTPSEIAEKLGWSSGRVFILTKHSKNYPLPTLQRFLHNLLVIDHRLKSSDTNPRLLVDLFIANTGN